MTTLTLPIILTLSVLFMRLLHPLAMGLMLLIQTIFISLSTGITVYSFWFSYILFLIFLGGMLVLFIYVASLASNEIFSFSLITLFYISYFLMVFSLLTFFIDLIMISSNFNLPMTKIYNSLSNANITSWIYNFPSMYLTLFIILYLLLTLMVVVKITSLFKGPLRLKN